MPYIDIHRKYRNLETKKVGSSISEVIEKKVTVDLQQILERHRGFTLFKEIQVVPFREFIAKDFIPQWIPAHNDRVSIKFLDRFIESVKNTWDSSKFHLIPHSMGYDSTILSKIIKMLYDDGSIDGDIFFVCFKPEDSVFLKIMENEGWDKSQYGVYNEKVSGRDYCREALQFSTAWQMYEDCWLWPVWYYQHAKLELQTNGKIPSDDRMIQAHCAGGVDELINFNNRKHAFSLLLSALYYTPLTAYWHGILPVFDDDILGDVFFKYKFQTFGNEYKRRVKGRMLQMLDSNSTLYQLPNSLRGFQVEYRRIPADLVQQMVRDYNNSWFGQKVAPDASKKATDVFIGDRWFACYSSAVIIEHLINEGIEVLKP